MERLCFDDEDAVTKMALDLNLKESMCLKPDKHTDEPAKKKNRDKRGRPRDAKDEVARCMEYLETYKDELTHETLNGQWFFRCKVCLTRHHPRGKLRKLPARTLNSVKWFVEQHVGCPTHLSFKKKMVAEQAEATAERKPCPGICVNADTHGNRCLQPYIAEFALWASHTVFKDHHKSQAHQYWRNVTDDQWWVRSKDCQGTLGIPVGLA